MNVFGTFSPQSVIIAVAELVYAHYPAADKGIFRVR